MNCKRSIALNGAALTAIALLAGCWHPQQQGTTTIIAPEAKAATNQFVPTPNKPVTDLTQSLAAFDARAFQLPGKGEVAHRALMEDTFTDLIAILPVLEGPEPDGGFRQQMHLIDQDREQLIALSWNANGEGIEAAAMRAAYTAMEAIYSRRFSDSSDLGKSMDDLGAKMDELDLDHGDAAKLAVTQGVRGMSAIMRQMNVVLQQQLATVRAAEKAASTMPLAPTTAPAPTSAPAQ